MADLEMLKSFLLTAESPDDFRLSYIKALSSSGPIQMNRAIALSNYLKADPVRKINQVELAEKRSFSILEDKLPCAFEISGRKKAFISFTKKLHKKDVAEIHDLYAFRTILDDTVIGIPNATVLCYDAVKWLTHDLQRKYGYNVIKVTTNSSGVISEDIKSQIFIPDPTMVNLGGHVELVKDYVMLPKPNGYQSLHIILLTPDGLFIEVQIKTWTMHVWAEYGLANHQKFYKPKDEIDELLEQKGEDFVHELAHPIPIGVKLVHEQMPELNLLDIS